MLCFLIFFQTPAQHLWNAGAKARASIKTLMNKTYICENAFSLERLAANINAISEEFDEELPKDQQGLITPNECLYRLYERQKVLRKVVKERHRKQREQQARLSGIRPIPNARKRGRLSITSRLRCRVGVKGEKEKAKLKASLSVDDRSSLISGKRA